MHMKFMSNMHTKKRTIDSINVRFFVESNENGRKKEKKKINDKIKYKERYLRKMQKKKQLKILWKNQ